jgi:hypothetical protein
MSAFVQSLQTCFEMTPILATFYGHICLNDSFWAHAQCACAPRQSFNIGPSGHFVEETELTLLTNANFSGRFGNRTSDLQAIIYFLRH